MWPSWSGKSTLLNMLSWLDLPDSGEITINGDTITAMSEDERTRWRSRHIAFIFQQFLLIPNLTVQDNIDLVIDISWVARRFSTEEILNKVWLPGFGSRYPHQLSGGEQQRVAIARAFVWQLPILLADEPTGNLDHRNAVMIMDLMMQLHQELGTTVVIITHDPAVASYAQTQYVLTDGLLNKQ
jgi:putative ABC transport system ATP-binding protein